MPTKTVRFIDQEEEPDFADDYEPSEPVEEYSVSPEPRALSDINLSFPCLSLFFGSSGTGKTNAMLVLLRRYARQFGAIFVFCGTKDISQDWSSVLDPRCIFGVDDLTDRRIEMILKLAGRLKKRDKHTLVIVDDAMGATFHNNKVWDVLASSSRHSNLSLFVASQHAAKLSPIIKGNSNFVFVTKVSSQNLENLYEYVEGFENKAEFVSFLKENWGRGRIFFNDKKDVFDAAPYEFLEVPKADPFRIRLV